MSYFIKKNEIGICRGFLIDCSQSAFNKPEGIGRILSHKLFNITLSVAMNDENITSFFQASVIFLSLAGSFCPDVSCSKKPFCWAYQGYFPQIHLVNSIKADDWDLLLKFPLLWGRGSYHPKYKRGNHLNIFPFRQHCGKSTTMKVIKAE